MEDIALFFSIEIQWRKAAKAQHCYMENIALPVVALKYPQDLGTTPVLVCVPR